jgi:hypothetical protein
MEEATLDRAVTRLELNTDSSDGLERSHLSTWEFSRLPDEYEWLDEAETTCRDVAEKSASSVG